MNSAPLPPVYLSHGSPMIALEPREAGAFMQRLGPALDGTFGRPRAILALSAHTLARQPVLLAAARHEAVHDFGGFEPQLYRLRYDASGAPALADEVGALLSAAGMPALRVDAGGLDHGLWTALRHVYPRADVPVLPLAFVPTWSPARLFDFGAALAPLATRGVWIVGSGSLTHNLHAIFGAQRAAIDAAEVPESAAFRRWVQAHAAAADVPALLDYRARAPHAALMHPTDEHWLPWYPTHGAGGRDARAHRLHASLTYGCLAMDAYAFGPQAGALARALG